MNRPPVLTFDGSVLSPSERKGTLIGVRIQPDALAALHDAWTVGQPDQTQSGKSDPAAVRAEEKVSRGP